MANGAALVVETLHAANRDRRDPMNLNVPRRLDADARLHLGRFAGQVAVLVMCCAPTLVIDQNAPVLFLALLGTLCRFIALFLFAVGFFFRAQTPGKSFGPWDHCLAFLLLQFGCNIALDLIR